MAKASKPLKTATKAAFARPGKVTPEDKPALRAIKGGKNGSAKSQPQAAVARPGQKPASKPLALKPAPAVADDVPVIALNLEPAKLTPAMAAYFKKCQDKLGFVPNVLLAYAFDMAKLESFAAMYNDLMLGESGLSKLEREMIAVVVSVANDCAYCIAAHGAALRKLTKDPALADAIAADHPSAPVEQRVRAMLEEAGAPIVWAGGAVAVQVFGFLAQRANDPAQSMAFGRNTAWLASRVFMPASAVVLVAGVLLTEDGNWPWSEPFVWLGLVGWAQGA